MIMTLAEFAQIINNDCHKVQLIAKDLNDAVKSKYAGKFFHRITEKNIDEIKDDLPTLNYNSSLTSELISVGRISKNLIYNEPDNVKFTSSKSLFYQEFEKESWMIKSSLKFEDAKKLSFPVFGKTDGSHSGKGIKKFTNPENLKDGYDIYVEGLKFSKEYRIIQLNDKVLFWLEKIPSESGFKWFSLNSHDSNCIEISNNIIKPIQKRLKLELIALDYCVTNNGDIKVFEANSAPGWCYDLPVKVYATIFEDFYGRSVNSEFQRKLNLFSEYYIKEHTDHIEFFR